MVSLTALWLPMLISAVVVFIASSIVHMVLTYHRTDFAKLPSEEEVSAALRKFNLPPWDPANLAAVQCGYQTCSNKR